MHHFTYQNGILHAEDVNLFELAETVGTPFYCYSSATLERHYRVLAEAFGAAKLDALICYAIKANSNQAVIKTLAKLGAGMDVVSEGELRRARAANVPGDKIIFAGVGKTREEMAYALDEGILSFNVESEPELIQLSEVAAGRDAPARISIRVNPDVDPRTHAKIATGRAENKFGIPFAQAPALYEKAAALPAIEVAGIHMHIGSQITDLEPFGAAFALMRQMVIELRGAGHNIKHLDMGGGLGIPYRGDNDIPPPPADYAGVIANHVGDLELKLVFEPGRMIAGNAGILVGQVIYAKMGADKVFTVTDIAMNDLLRPTLYDAYHDIWPVAEEKRGQTNIIQDVVGPVCETGDYVAQSRDLPPLQADDLIAVMSAGAYGAVMASTYNTRRLIPEVLVRGREYAIVRPRPSFDELIKLDRLPDWLND